MNKCPFCGRTEGRIYNPEITKTQYLCGSNEYLNGDFGRSIECYKNQITALKEQNQSLGAHAVLDEQEIAVLKGKRLEDSGALFFLRNENKKQREEIAALKEKIKEQEIEIAALITEGRELNEEMKSWRVYFKERLDAWRAVKPMLRYPNWPDSGNQWITDAIDKLKALGEI
jgi:chromosome segregation ATPase